MPAGSALSRREGSGGPGAAFQDGQGVLGQIHILDGTRIPRPSKKSDDQDRRTTIVAGSQNVCFQE
jgi:hypothetical protein